MPAVGAPAWNATAPDENREVRERTVGHIIDLLRQKKPDADHEWLNKLPDIAKRLEDHLYRTAKSLAEYDDLSTLKNRLQLAATELRGGQQQLSPAAPSQAAPPPPAPPPPPR